MSVLLFGLAILLAGCWLAANLVQAHWYRQAVKRQSQSPPPLAVVLPAAVPPDTWELTYRVDGKIGTKRVQAKTEPLALAAAMRGLRYHTIVSLIKL